MQIVNADLKNNMIKNHSCSCSNRKYPLLILLRLINANSFRNRLLYSGFCTPLMGIFVLEWSLEWSGAESEPEFAIFPKPERSRSVIFFDKTGAEPECNFKISEFFQ